MFGVEWELAVFVCFSPRLPPPLLAHEETWSAVWVDVVQYGSAVADLGFVEVGCSSWLALTFRAWFDCACSVQLFARRRIACALRPDGTAHANPRS